MSQAPSSLERELQVFEENRDRLIGENPSGGYVVIHQDQILGVWNDRMDALSAGVKAFGDIPFLVKDLNEDEATTHYFTRRMEFA